MVALNVADTPLVFTIADAGAPAGHIIAGSGAPPADIVRQVQVEPHGWAIVSAATPNR